MNVDFNAFFCQLQYIFVFDFILNVYYSWQSEIQDGIYHRIAIGHYKKTKNKISETRNITEHKLYILYMNNHWMLPYKIKNVRVNQKSKMVATTGQIWQRTLCRKCNKQSESIFNWHFFGYPFTNPRCLSFKLKPNCKM